MLAHSVHGLAHSIRSLSHETIEIYEYVFKLQTCLTGLNLLFVVTRNTPYTFEESTDHENIFREKRYISGYKLMMMQLFASN